MRRTHFTVISLALAASVLFPLSAGAEVVYNTWQNIPYSFVVPSTMSAQGLLISEGYLHVPFPTGFFGAQTRDAVTAYQTAHQLAPTGVIGAITRRLMNKEIGAARTLTSNREYNTEGAFLPLLAGQTEKVLSVPLVEQAYPLSCEMASLEMALGYRGISETQDDLIAKLGVAAPFEKKYNIDGTYTWGDPDEGFVGDVRGWMFTPLGTRHATGWGANKAPVAKIAKMFRPESFAVSGTTIADITQEIDAGNPVIAWEYSPLPASLLTLSSYRTPSGKKVAFMPTHVNLIVGYKTNTDGSHILLFNDPEYGRTEISEASFDKDWARYNRDLVVVR